MGAHGLTIMKQIRDRIGDSDHSNEFLAVYVDGALGAPGTCITAEFDPAGWDLLNSALADFRTNGKRGELRQVVDLLIHAHAWMEPFRDVEEIKVAARVVFKEHGQLPTRPIHIVIAHFESKLAKVVTR